jgi:hypothetical protein
MVPNRASKTGQGGGHRLKTSLSAASGNYDCRNHPNENPKPFIWTAKADDILEKVKRARKALNNAQSV